MPSGRNSERVYRFALRIGDALFRILRLRRDVLGAQNVPRSGAAILAITHFGYLDFALVQHEVWRNTRRLTRFLVTDVAFAHRLSGPPLRAMRHIPVNRRSGAGAYRMAARALRQGELVGIFPESAVSPSDELLPFKPGAAALAAETGAPVIPVMVWGGQRVMSKGLPLQWTRARGAPVHIEFGRALHFPADTDPYQGTAELRHTLAVMVSRMATNAPERSLHRLLAQRRLAAGSS